MTRNRRSTTAANTDAALDANAPRHRAQRRRGAPRAAAPFKRTLLVETLEQRVLMDADPLAVATVNGRIDSPGEVDAYTFTLDNATKVSFDSLVNDGNLRWSLTGPSGTLVSAQPMVDKASHAPYAPLSLGAGDYRLEVDGVGGAAGADYSFRLIDLSRAATLSTGTAVAGTLAAPAQQQPFAFDGQAGQALWLDLATLPADTYLRLHDPFGNKVGGDLWGSQELPALPYNGRYTLVLDAGVGAPAGAAFNFTLQPMATPVTALGPLGSAAEVNGTLAAAGDRALVQFTLDTPRRLILDSRTATDSLRLTLTGPTGTVVDANGQALAGIGLNQLDDYASTRGVLSLDAGSYTLQIDGDGATTGAYSLRLVDAAAPTAITRGTLTSGQLDPGAALQVYRLAATAGDSISIDAQQTGPYGDVDWTLYDPYGRRVNWASYFYDSGAFTLGVTGDYTLVVSGTNSRSAPTDYAFTIVDNGNTPAPLPAGTPLTLGTAVVDGSIAVAGSSQVWRFTLATPTAVYFDPLTGSMPYGTYVTLQGPRGTETSDARFGGYYNAYWDDGQQNWVLPAGDYALTLRADQAVPAYQFRLLDMAASATALPTGSQVSGELNPGSGAAFYTFDAAAGERIFLDYQDVGGTSLERRMLDPWGRQLDDLVGGDGNHELVLPYAGRYTFVVEGHNTLAAPVAYTFTLQRPVDKTLAYDLGVAQLPTVQWASDGSAAANSNALHFDGAQAATVATDPGLSLAGDLSMQLRFKVDNLDRDWQSILYKGNNSNSGYERNYSVWVNRAGYVHVSFGNDYGEYVLATPNGSVKPGQWTDMTAVLDRSNGTLRVYMDGVQMAQRTDLAPPSIPNHTYNTPLTIGNARENWHNNQSGLEGAVSEVRLWSRALSATEVTGLLTTEPDAASDSALALWLRFNEGTGSTVADASGHGRSASMASVYAGVPGVVVGSIDQPGQRVTYTLSLPEAKRMFFDSLTQGSEYTVQFSGPNTALNQDLSWTDSNNNLIDLPAGDYRITIDGNGQATGAFAFRVLDAAQATAIGFGAPVSGELNPGDQAHLYRFDAAAGEVLFFDMLGQTGYSAAQWRLLDPFGRAVFSQTAMGDRENITLATAGSYTLVVDGYPYERDRWTGYSFVLRQVTPQPAQAITIGTSFDAGVQRTTGREGGSATGAVALNDAQYVEITGDATNLTGSSTIEAWFQVDQASTGTWTPLFTKTNGDAERQYGLWLNANGSLHAEARDANGYATSLATAAGLVPNAAGGGWHHVALVLDRANSQMRLVLDGTQVSAGYLSPTASLVLPEALRLGRNAEGYPDHEGYNVSVDELRLWDHARSTASIAAGMTTPLAGNEAGLAALYRFAEAAGPNLVDAVGGAANGHTVRLADLLPGLVTGRIGEMGEVRTYRFTLDTERTLYLDSFTHRHDLTWRLNGPGVDLSSSLYSADSNSNYNLLRLAAGTYTFTVDGSGAAVGDFAFRLVDVGTQAQAIGRDVAVNTRLAPGAMARLFTFDASAGERLFLDTLAYDGQQPVWRLIDPRGAQVMGLSWMADVDTLTLNRSGRYTLIVEDYTAAGTRSAERNVSFMVRTVADRRLDLPLGSRQLAAPVWTSGPAVADAFSPAVQLGNGQQIVVDADPALDLTGNFTIEAMVNLDAWAGGWMPVVSRASDFDHQTFGLWIGAQGQLYLDSHQGSGTDASEQFWNLGSAAGVVQPGGWHRVSASVNRDTGEIASYVDGVLVASRTLGYWEIGPATSLPGAELRIGGTALTDGRSPLLGAVADVRVWDRALGASEIGAAATTDLAGTETGLVLNLKLGEGTGTALADSGPLGLDGRVESLNAKLGGTLVEDTISAVGQRVVYTLHAGADTRLLFDGLTSSDRFTWTLLNSSGQPVVDNVGQTLSGRNLRSSDHYSTTAFTLRAGQDYTLVVDASGDATGRYAFRLLDLAQAQPIAYDQSSVNVYSLVRGPTHGTLDLLPDGHYSYTPADGYTGADSFEYRWLQPDGQIFAGLVDLTVAADLLPAPADDNFTVVLVDTGEGLFGTLDASVAGNDSAGNGSLAEQHYELVDGPAAGNLSFNADGSFTYSTSGVGTESFTYRMVDTDGDGVLATVTLTSGGVIANDDSYVVAENRNFGANLLDNDNLPAGTGYTVEVLEPPAQGAVHLETNGNLYFEPAFETSGSVSFSYRIADADGNTLDTATVTIEVEPGPGSAALDAADDAFGIPAGWGDWGSNVRFNDTLAGGGGNQISLVSGASQGTVTLQADGSFLYSRDPAHIGEAGSDAFTYRWTHGGVSDTAVVDISFNLEALAAAPLQAAGSLQLTPAATAPLTTTAVAVAGSTLAGALAAPTPPTVGTNDPANSTTLYRFDGQAGDQVRFDYLNHAGNSPYWRVFDELGHQIFAADFVYYGDSGTVTLPTTGRYTVAIEGQIDATGVARHEFQVQLLGHVDPPGLPTGTPVSFVGGVASISTTTAAVNERQVFTFTLAEPRRVYVDALNSASPNYYALWDLTGQQGSVGQRWAYDTDGVNRRSYYELPAGDYAFSVWTPYDWALGASNFRLIDIDASLQPISLGAGVTGTLSPANSAAFFGFSADAGDRLFVSATQTTNLGNAYWRVLDAQTLATVSEGYFNNPPDGTPMPHQGNYILALEGYYGTAGEASYGFTVHKTTQAQQALALGSTVQASIAAPGDTQAYTFTLGAATRLWFDALTERTDIVWRVLDSDGVAVLPDRYLADYTNWYDGFALDAGSYTLVVDGSGAATGAFGFRLLDMGQAVAITAGTAQAGQLTPANETDLYSFTAQAGERYYFDMLSRSGSPNLYWRLYDPYGQRVWAGTDLQDVDVTTLAYSGRYTLAIEGYPGNTGTATYSFNVVPVLPQTPVALSIGLQPAPNLQVQGLVVAGSDGSIHSGGSLNLAWTTQNAGDRAVAVAFQERVIVRNALGQVVVNQLVAYDPVTSGNLAVGASLARSAQVQLPPGAAGAGTLAISVVTDTGNAILEKGPDGENDNTTSTSVTSTLLVYPDLTVGGLTVLPNAGLAAGTPVTVQWQVGNAGDATPGAGWSDRVQVRNLSTGAVLLDALTPVGATGPTLAPGATLARQFSFNWPAGTAAAGEFEVTVTVDATDTVAEYNADNTAETHNSASTRFTSAPDLTVDGLAVLTATPVSGGEVQLAWTVHNQGNAPTPAGWFDRITAVNLDTGATLVNLDVAYTPAAALAVGGSAARTFTLRLPEGTGSVGNIRFTVVADQNVSGASGIAETQEGNNAAAVDKAAVLRTAPNLVVSDFSAPATQRSGDAANFNWTVRNSGNAATAGTAWFDRIVLSGDAVIGNGDDVTVATVAHSGALAAGASYDVAWTAVVPGGYDGSYRFAVVTDVFNSVVEPDAEADNTSALRSTALTAYHADLLPEVLSLPASGLGGSTVPVTWRVSNQGDAATSSNWWLDRLWLSPDGSIGPGSGAIDLGTVGHGGTLAPGAHYEVTQDITLPNGVTGNYRLVVQTDLHGWVFESRFKGNNTALSAGSITLTEAPAVDLRVENVSGPAQAQPGQLQTVAWEIHNTGSGEARAPWTDHVYVSPDGTLAGAIYVTSLTHGEPLAAGARVQANAQFWMPDLADGAWQVVVVTDVHGQVFETGPADAESANRGAGGTTQVVHPDVRTTDLGWSAGAAAGRASTFTWTTRNDGSAAALPGWVEQVFLSSDSVLDGADVLLGSYSVDTALAAGGTLARSASVNLPANLAAGNWRFLVRSDAGNALYELAGEANNLAASPVVAVAEAPLPNLVASGVAGPASMRPGQTVTVQWTETNTLAEPASGSWAAQIFLSSDANIGADQLVGTATFTGTVPGNGSVARSAELSLPTTLQPGNWRFVVRVDAGNALLERNELDNTAIAAAGSVVGATLQLVLASDSVAEAAGSTTATVQRNGDLSLPLTVALTTSDASEATVPTTVTIPAGQAALSFHITLPADGVVDGTQTVLVSASASGLASDSRTLGVTDSDVPALTLAAVLAVQENQGSVRMTVFRNTDAAAGDLLVRLTSSGTAMLRVPGTVVIPAGATSASFDATLVDDAEVWGTRDVRVNAVADGYLGHSVNVPIADDELPELTLLFSSTQVSEGAGANSVGVTLRRDRAGIYDLVLNVASDNRDALSVPTRVVIPAGETEVSFTASPVNNGQVDGNRGANVRATMMAPNGMQVGQNAASAAITITDDDGPTLSVSLSADSVSEQGSTVTGTVRRNTGTAGDLVVTLSSTDVTEATVAATTVTILDGQDSATFSIHPVADGVVDGTQAVTLRASATGYNAGAAGLNITEGDLPDLVVTEIGQPGGGLAKSRIDISWTVSNAGLADAPGGFRDRVYLSRDSELSAVDRLLAAVIHTTPVARGGSYTQTASVQLPEATGEYRIIIVTDALGTVAEGTERNNVGTAAVPITVRAPITATVQTAVTQLAVGGEAGATLVPLTGSALDVTTGAPAANQPVTVLVRVGTVERLLDATTDASGNFTLNFTPLPGEVGHFELGAGYAGDSEFAVQDRFTLIGIDASVPHIRTMGTNETPLEGSFTLTNLTDVALSGLTATVSGLANNFDFEVVGLAPSLAGDGTVTVNWRFTGHGVTDRLEASRGSLVITTAEGASQTLVLDLACIPQTPKLVASPGYLAQGMLRGEQTLVSFQVFNQGAADTGVVQVQIPEFPWLTLASAAEIANIAPGESATVTLSLRPDEATELIRFDGSIALNARLGGLTMPFQFRAVSEAQGEMRVTVEDQLTYYAEGAPKLAGATVTLTDPYTFEVVATATTDATGTVLLADIPEGNYILTVNADKHSSYRATKTITPGTTSEQTIFLDRQLVTYAWNVVPVDIQDRYKIVLESTFETEVPVPVITVDALKMPVVLPGVTSTTTLTVTNHGLIQAEAVEIRVPYDDLFEIVALTPLIDILPAKSSVEVPITIRVRDGVTPQQLAGATLAGNGLNAEGWGSAIVKCLGIDTAYKLRCGPDGRWYTESTSIKPVLCAMDFTEAGAGQLLSHIGGDFNLLDLGCDALDLLLACFDADDCLSFFINAACGAAVGAAVGGPWGAAAGAAGALDDLLACLCQVLGPVSVGTPTSSSSTPWTGWGWYPGGGTYSGSGWSYNITYVNCRGEAVSAVEQQRADLGLLEAVASGAVADDAVARVEAHNEARADALATAVAEGDGILNAEEAGICAQVRIRIEQEAVLTRTAFQGTLEVTNGNTGVPLTGVQMVLDIRDEAGNSVNDIFATRGPTLSGMTAVDGTGVLDGGATGRAQYLFIPTVDAARDEPKRYTIGGTLSYIEAGQKITVPLLPAQITVFPEARLNLHYFQQRDVYADDPFTEVVEPSEAFSLGLLAYNDGKGDARNFSITSAQPKIVENEKGLLIDFKIVGTQVGEEAVAPTLTANIGNIAAGQTQVAQWLMTSSLQGKFVDYSATFEHVDGMGDVRLSLIESVNIHELIRAVKANAGDAPDFLANDDPDPDHTPDRLYMNDGAQHVVRTLANAHAGSSAAPGALAVTLTADAASGWGYFKLSDPGVGYALDRIVRSDGKVLTLGREVWRTDRSFPEALAGAVRENLLHFVDDGSTGSYTAYYKIDDAVAPRLVEVLAVSPDPATGPVDTIDVHFSEALDPATFTVADLQLSREGEADANLLAGVDTVTVTALGDGNYRIAGLASFTATGGLYRLTVNAAGVADHAGNAGDGVATETWGVGDIGPYVLSLAAGPAARHTALDTVDVGFNTALDAASFNSDDLRLERDGVVQSLAGVSLTLTPLAGNQYRIGGLAAATGADGHYSLTLLAGGLLSSGGAAGLGSRAVGWRMDSVAPRVLNVVDLVDKVRKTVVMALDVELSEPVDITRFDYRDIVLTRTVAGATSANLVDARTQVERLSGNVYRVTGFNWVSGVEGSYTFSLNGEGLADEAGNAGSGSASESWTMDFHDPLAASALAITPDNGVADTDGVSNALAFTLTGTLAEPGLTVRVSDRTTGNELGYATVSGTTFSIPVALDAAGRHELRVRSVDASGNLADATLLLFIDQVRPELAEPVLGRDGDGNVDTVTLNFSEAVDAASLGLAALALTRDGGTNLLAGATLTRVTDTQYRLSGLAALTAPAGSYRFTVDLAQVRDLAGNAGGGSTALAFDGALASTGSVSGVAFDDIDGNGTREADELAQGGWTVFDDADGDGALGAGEAFATTDELGRYHLTGLALGTHRIVVLVPEGWTVTPAPAASLTLAADAPEVTHNFGVFALAGLAGTVYDDANANGVFDAGEAALAGRQVLLDRNGNGTADAGETSATTDDAGRYLFSQLSPGTVRLVLFAGDGWLPLQPAGFYSPQSGGTATRDLAAVRPGLISGMKYEDLNGNGQRDADDAGVAGWRVFLDDNGNDALDVGERYTLTDSTGHYAFANLLPGSYRVVEEVRSGWVQTAPGTIEAGNGSEQALDVLLSLPGMVADIEENLLAQYLSSTGLNYNCGCGTFVLEKYTTGQAASHFSKLDTIADPTLAGLTGKGVRVAVIDTGIALDSSFFGADANGDGVGDRIAFQYDFGDADADASDTIGHGTNVAGVIAGDDARYAGIATEADLVVLKVFDSNRQGYMSMLKQALEWVDANAEAYGIGVVNLSLGDGGNWGEAISRYGMGELFERLAAKGLVTIAASGNNYYQTGGALGVAYPGADPAVLSVGAMWAGNFGGPWRFSSGATDYTTAYGRIASFTQRDPDQVDVMAPGARFTSAGLNGGLSTMQGTSQAAAFMSGAAALVQQAAKELLGRFLTTGEFAALLDANTYRAVDGDDESDNVANSSAVYNKLDIPKLLRGLQAYAQAGAGGTGGDTGGGAGTDAPLQAYSARTLALQPGQTVAEQDFGNFRLGQVSGLAFADANADGVQQAGEAPYAGVAVFLDANGNGLADSGEQQATTGTDGRFAFAALGPGAVTAQAATPSGQQATTATGHTVTVTSGMDLSTLRFGFAAPVVQAFTAVDDGATTDEDNSVTVNVLANDDLAPASVATGLVLAVAGAGPAHGSVVVVDGQFVYTPDANFHGTDGFTYTVSAPDGRSSSASVAITVRPVNDAPTLAPVAPASVNEGSTLVVQLVAADADAGDTLVYALLEGPAGASVDAQTGELRWTATDLDLSPAFRVQVSDAAGARAERSFRVDVRLGQLVVTAFEQAAWGFALRFNDTLNTSAFNLYGAAPDLVVTGAQAGAVRGSVVFDADGRGLQFVRTGGPLQADSYTVQLKAGAAALTSSRRGDLDGDANGTAGGDWAGSFTAAAAPAVRLRLPDFARSAGQAIQVPNTGTGLPVMLVTDGSTRSLSFVLKVDPALITVSELQRGTGLPAGATVDITTVAGGFQVHINSASALPAGQAQVLNLVARMASGGVSGSAGVVQLEAVQINGVAAPAAADAGVVFVGQTGDIDLNGRHDANDVIRLQRLVVKLDTAVMGADDIDPTVIGDVDADGALTSRDVAYVLQRRSLAATAMVPAMPAPTSPDAAPPSPVAGPGVTLSGTGSLGAARAAVGTAALNLSGSLANFKLSATTATPVAATSNTGAAAGSSSLPVALKVVPSAVSTGAKG